jgi:hypothetical protein
MPREFGEGGDGDGDEGVRPDDVRRDAMPITFPFCGEGEGGLPFLCRLLVWFGGVSFTLMALSSPLDFGEVRIFGLLAPVPC